MVEGANSRKRSKAGEGGGREDKKRACVCAIKGFSLQFLAKGRIVAQNYFFFCVCLVVLLFQLLRALNASGAVKESERVKWLEEWRGAGEDEEVEERRS